MEKFLHVNEYQVCSQSQIDADSNKLENRELEKEETTSRVRARVEEGNKENRDIQEDEEREKDANDQVVRIVRETVEHHQEYQSCLIKLLNK